MRSHGEVAGHCDSLRARVRPRNRSTPMSTLAKNPIRPRALRALCRPGAAYQVATLNPARQKQVAGTARLAQKKRRGHLKLGVVPSPTQPTLKRRSQPLHAAAALRAPPAPCGDAVRRRRPSTTSHGPPHPLLLERPQHSSWAARARPAHALGGRGGAPAPPSARAHACGGARRASAGRASSALSTSGKVGRPAGSLARQAEPSAASGAGTPSPNSSCLFWMVTQKMICARAAARRQRPRAHARRASQQQGRSGRPARAGAEAGRQRAPETGPRPCTLGGARLHLHHARPGPLAGGQLPQQHAEAVHIRRLAQLACAPRGAALQPTLASRRAAPDQRGGAAAEGAPGRPHGLGLG